MPRVVRRPDDLTEQHHRTADIPLAVWPCAQQTSQCQRQGRYAASSNRHPAKMLPALARQAIATCSERGDLVVDPMCGIGATLVEAAHLGRRAVSVELDQRWVRLARENVAQAGRDGAAGTAKVIRGDARKLPGLLARERGSSVGKVARLPAGSVDLVLTSPPYACEVGEVDKEAWGRGCDLCPTRTRNYGTNRCNLGHARGEAYLTAMAEIYAACSAVLKPGGFLLVVRKDMRVRGALRDLAGDTIDLCQRVGLGYWQHVIALLAKIRDGELVPRPSFGQLTQIRRALARGERTHLVCHEDVLVFRKSRATSGSVPCRSSTDRPPRPLIGTPRDE